MKIPVLAIKKILLGIVLVFLAALITMIIKDKLDTQDPESALPSIAVSYNGAPISEDAVLRAGYEWNFLTTREQSPILNIDDLPLYAVDVLPQVPMRISFSKKPETLKISRAQGRGSSDFVELTTEKPGELLTPSVPGVYIYKVEASWKLRGSILYFFSVQAKTL